MTLHDHSTVTRDQDDDRVRVSPGVPTDRIRWGPILAGTFAALTALAVLSTLGTAIGLSAYDPGQDDPRNFARAGGVWGVLSLILAFAFGGWLTARAAAVRGRDNGLLNGFMVAGFGIPLMLFMLGSLASSVGNTAAQVADDAQQAGNSQSDGAMTASAQIGGSGGNNATVGGNPTAQLPDNEEARKAGSRAAWGTLFGLILAIAAASAAGAIGARDDRDHHRRDHDRDRYSAGGGAGGGTTTSTTASSSAPTSTTSM